MTNGSQFSGFRDDIVGHHLLVQSRRDNRMHIMHALTAHKDVFLFDGAYRELLQYSKRTEYFRLFSRLLRQHEILTRRPLDVTISDYQVTGLLSCRYVQKVRVPKLRNAGCLPCRCKIGGKSDNLGVLNVNFQIAPCPEKWPINK